MLACSVALAPTMVVACEVACASAPAVEGAHGCHHQPAADSGWLALHGCNHDDDVTLAEKLAPLVAAAVPAAVTQYVFAPDAPPLILRLDTSRDRPPDRSPGVTPLRI